MEFLSALWTDGIFRPMLNLLIFLYIALFRNFGVAILAFTALVRLAMIPLTVKQLKSTKAMTALQPKMEEVKRKYANDRQALNQEMMKIYRQQGMNPFGCLGPFVIQMPIFFGLYQAITSAQPTVPEGLVDLSQHLYSWLPGIDTVIPINDQFLGLHLGLETQKAPVPLAFILVALVGASSWVMQKMTVMPTADPRQQSTNQMMLWFMPAMLAFWTFSFPSGLAVYWVVSNLMGIGIQYFVSGGGALFPTGQAAPASAVSSVVATNPQPVKENVGDGESRDDRENGGRSHRARTGKAGRRPRRGRIRGR